MTTYAGLYPAEQGVDSHGVLLLIYNREKRDNMDMKTMLPDDSIPLWLPVANIVDVSSPSLTKSFHDVTPSIPGAWKRVVPGYKDGGSVSLSVLFNLKLGAHKLLLDSYIVDAKETFRVVIPDTPIYGPDTHVYRPRVLPDEEHLREDDPVLIIFTTPGIIIGRESDGWHWAFDGYVSGISTSHSAGGIIIGNVNIKVTGKVTTVSSSQVDWPDVSSEDTTYSYVIR